MYSIRLLKGAVEELARLDRATGRRMMERLHWLAANAAAIRPEPLKGGLRGLYKLREGDYRIIYELLPQQRLILVHCIGHRREVYRRTK